MQDDTDGRYAILCVISAGRVAIDTAAGKWTNRRTPFGLILNGKKRMWNRLKPGNANDEGRQLLGVSRSCCPKERDIPRLGWFGLRRSSSPVKIRLAAACERFDWQMSKVSRPVVRMET